MNLIKELENLGFKIETINQKLGKVEFRKQKWLKGWELVIFTNDVNVCGENKFHELRKLDMEGETLLLKLPFKTNDKVLLEILQTIEYEN